MNSHTNISGKLSLALALGTLALCQVLHAQTVVVSNTAESTGGSAGALKASGFMGVDQWGGGSFTTGATAMNLDSVILDFLSVSNVPGLQLSIYSNASDRPGVSLAVLGSATTIDAGNLIYAFAPTSTLALQPTTTYWWISNYVSDGQYSVGMTASTNETSAFGWTIGNGLVQSSNGGTSWNVDTLYTMQFSVAASAVPEPSTYAAILGAAALVLAGVKRRLRHSVRAET